MKIGKNQTLVLGPPGCGKTTDLLSRVEEFLGTGTKPNRVAFVSFTRKAVLEATSRACKKFNLKTEDFPFFKTIHSLCFSLLDAGRDDMMGTVNYRELGDALGYRFDGTFEESETGMPSGAKEGDKLLFMDNYARVSMKPYQQAWADANADVQWHAFERFFQAHDAYKKANGLMDFTDLLSRVAARDFSVDVDVLFVDEAQDLSKLQWAVLKKVFGNVPQVFIAGDDDQSIYRWSGADVRTFLDLEGKRVLLSQSHRLPRSVYDASIKIIHQVNERFEKPYRPRDAQGTISWAMNLEQVDFFKAGEGTTLCLARNIFLLDKFASALKTHGVPFTQRGGFSSVKKPHIEAILAWEGLRKGDAISGRAAKYMYEQMRIGPFLKRGGKTSIATLDDKALVTVDALQKNYGLAKLDIWHNALDGIPIDEREYYLTMLRKGVKLRGTPSVQINTIHGVKGGEADHVIVLSDISYRTWQELQRKPDDEHRVAYVAVTRSKEHLTLVMPGSSFSYTY